jgi:hypothetical protein
MDYLPGISLFGRLSVWLAGGREYIILLLALSGGEKGALSGYVLMCSQDSQL